MLSAGPSLYKSLHTQHSWGKMAEHYQQRRPADKNQVRGDEDPNRKKEVESDRPQVNNLSKQALEPNKSVVGRKPIGEDQPNKNYGSQACDGPKLNNKLRTNKKAVEENCG